MSNIDQICNKILHGSDIYMNYVMESNRFKNFTPFPANCGPVMHLSSVRTSILLHWSFLLIIVCFLFLQVVNSAGLSFVKVWRVGRR